ncbi:MAG: 30S ribosomal protein S3 [Clostridia bacterium]|jgi:small subunit ribosomal protein S3|nr:30S ribosomal protein S3 [Clostridia bacterium]MCR4682697.1 30S ribosomal protein S3 [Clostridiales bacterium]
MGQKVNPKGLRVGVIKDWDSRWCVKDEIFGDVLVSDYNIRKLLKKELFKAGVPRIEIERDQFKVKVVIHCAKPGVAIGRGGENIDKIKKEIENIVGKDANGKQIPVMVDIVEIASPDLNAQLVAENICAQLEGRVAFRRAMKMAIRNTMRLGARGIKVSCSGRLGGAEIARSEHYHEGTIPLQTLRADIDYGFWEANTTYGKIGVKVWIYNGEVLKTVAGDRRRNDRRGDRRNGDRRGDRRNGDRRGGDRRNGDNRGPRDGSSRNDRRNQPRTPRPAQTGAAPREGGNK